MIQLTSFPISPTRDMILRTVIKAENPEDVEGYSIMVSRVYTAEEIEDRSKQ